MEAGGSYELGKYIDMGSTALSISKDFELDLQDNKLSFSTASSSFGVFQVSADKTLKISNGDMQVSNSCTTVVYPFAGSSVVLEDITFDYTVTGGSIVAGTQAVSVSMTNCTVRNTAVRSANASNSFTVTGCDITQTGTSDAIDYLPTYNLAGLTVANGGKVTATNTNCDADAYAAYIYNSGGTINIDGGTWSGDIAVLKADASTTSTPSTINVSSGTFTGAISIASGADLNISGGTFNNTGITDINTFSAYVADGYEATSTGDDDYTVAVAADAAVASVTVDDVTTKYETLEKAFDAVSGTATHTITLLDDVEITSVISIQSGETAIFDMEGFTITYQQSGARPINNAGTLTINGENGTVTLVQLPMLLCVASC